MFERFTDAARVVVRLAVEEARAAGAVRTGTEHLLLALLRERDSVAAQALHRAGVDHAAARAARDDLLGSGDELDPDALRSIGIDLDSVRASVEASFGKGTLDSPAGAGVRRRGGHIPFSPRAKKVLELSLREAVRLKHGSISDAHLLLGILREGSGLAARMLEAAGVDRAALRADLEGQLRQAG